MREGNRMDKEILKIFRKYLEIKTECFGQGDFRKTITLSIPQSDYLGNLNGDFEKIKNWFYKEGFRK